MPEEPPSWPPLQPMTPGELRGVLSDLDCQRRSRPKAAIVRWRFYPLSERGERCRCDDRWRGAVVDALIAKALRTTLVVALDQLADPAR